MFTSLSPGTLSFAAPLDEALHLARAGGFAGLDLPVRELRDLAAQTSIQAVRDRFIGAGIRPGGWGLPVDFRGGEDVYQAGLAELPAFARIAEALGSPWCYTWIWPFSDDLDFGANMSFHVDRLRPVARILTEHGCRLGLEFVGTATLRRDHRYEFIHTIDGALDLGRRIGTGNTGLLLDCWHWYTSHATIADLGRLSADEVVYVHVNDAPANRAVDEQIDTQRLLPGASGVIDIAPFLRALDRMGYDGPVVAEPFNEDLKALPPAERAQMTGRSLAAILERAGLAV